jgi:hypothetical protein
MMRCSLHASAGRIPWAGMRQAELVQQRPTTLHGNLAAPFSEAKLTNVPGLDGLTAIDMKNLAVVFKALGGAFAVRHSTKQIPASLIRASQTDRSEK